MKTCWHVSPVHAKTPGIPEHGWRFVSFDVREGEMVYEAPDREAALKIRTYQLARLRRLKILYLTYSDLAQWRRAVKLLKEKTSEVPTA